MKINLLRFEKNTHIPVEERQMQRMKDVFETDDMLTELQEWVLSQTMKARTARTQEVLQELNEWAQKKMDEGP